MLDRGGAAAGTREAQRRVAGAGIRIDHRLRPVRQHGAHEIVAKAASDGYTLLLMTVTNTVGMASIRI